MSMPLLLLALLFAVFATVEWQRLPVVARVYVGVATTFAIGALTYPGATIGHVIENETDGIAALLGVARAAGFAAVMISAATALRRQPLR